MPIVNLKIAKGHSEEKKQKIVNEFTNILVETLNINPEWVSVLIDEYEHENWATGGTLHSIKFGKDWKGTIDDLSE